MCRVFQVVYTNSVFGKYMIAPGFWTEDRQFQLAPTLSLSRIYNYSKWLLVNHNEKISGKCCWHSLVD